MDWNSKLEGGRMSKISQHLPRFPESSWDFKYFAAAANAEIMSGSWRQAIETFPCPPGYDETMDEIQALIEYRNNGEREKNKLDIRLEDEQYLFRWECELDLRKDQHPKTYAMIDLLVIFVGRSVAQHLKVRYMRARPSAVCADVNPMISVPGHPAYPSGHGAQMHLVASAFSYLRPDKEERFTAIANGIAKNREIAGLHYPSDSVAGKLLADRVWPCLLQSTVFGNLIAAVAVELGASSL